MAEAFSLVRGGPLHELERRAHLRPGVLSRFLALAVVGWLPPVVVTLLFPAAPATLLALHARFLVAIPLLLAIERFVDARVGSAVGSFAEGGLVRAADGERFRRILAWCGRLRDSRIAAAVLAVLALAPSLAARHQDLPWARTAARTWIAWVSFPVFRFVLGVWLWRWMIWVVFLARTSRLDLRLVPTHADRAGGLGFVEPAALSFALVHLAAAVVIPTGLVGPLGLDHPAFADLAGLVAGFGCVVFAMVLGPLLLFTPRLIRARWQGLVQYGELVQRHDQLFADRWLPDRQGNPLGEPAISSLADLGITYSAVRAMRPLPLDRTSVLLLALVSVSPALPMLPAEAHAHDLLKRALQALLLPGG